jgi:alpha-tubulin suppressor-like RCC1 family protein
VVYPSSTGTAEPVSVKGLTGVVRIAAASSYSTAIRQDGTVWYWGTGEGIDEMGMDYVVALEPVQKQGLAGAMKVAQEQAHACALLEDATVWCWGLNDLGAFCTGSYEPWGEPPAPAPIRAGVSGVLDLSVGARHTCVLQEGGRAQCCGEASLGELGDGDFRDGGSQIVASPVSVLNLNGAVQLASGWAHTCALLENGTVKCWGLGDNGQLGDGQEYGYDFTDHPGSAVPVDVIGLTGVTEIAAGGVHSCALHEDGTLSCWGGYGGVLGDGYLYESGSLTPVSVLLGE